MEHALAWVYTPAHRQKILSQIAEYRKMAFLHDSYLDYELRNIMSLKLRMKHLQSKLLLLADCPLIMYYRTE